MNEGFNVLSFVSQSLISENSSEENYSMLLQNELFKLLLTEFVLTANVNSACAVSPILIIEDNFL